MTTWCSIGSKADPTPLVPALLAGDVIAASVLVCRDFAFGAWFHVVGSGKLLELCIAYIGAPDPAVVDTTTLHANFLSAYTDCSLRKTIPSSDEVQAPVARTPTQVRIKVHVNVHLEPNILLKDLL